jgi:Ku protein
MWKGAISFGLVMIPIKLYAATEQKDIAFRQVHREDGGRIRFRRVCSIDGQEVPYEDVAKGYELPTGEMVVLTDEDLADLPLPTTRSIEVLHFLPAEQLDSILLNRSYFVEPEAAGARAYVLLRDSLERSGKVALALVALRQRESLATLRTRDGLLVLETLLWPDEVRTPDFPFLEDDIEVRSQELKMARAGPAGEPGRGCRADEPRRCPEGEPGRRPAVAAPGRRGHRRSEGAAPRDRGRHEGSPVGRGPQRRGERQVQGRRQGGRGQRRREQRRPEPEQRQPDEGRNREGAHGQGRPAGGGQGRRRIERTKDKAPRELTARRAVS